jgi:hypothetical protein
MSLKLGTGKTRTLSVCLSEEQYNALKAMQVAEPLRFPKLATVVRWLIDSWQRAEAAQKAQT